MKKRRLFLLHGALWLSLVSSLSTPSYDTGSNQGRKQLQSFSSSSKATTSTKRLQQQRRRRRGRGVGPNNVSFVSSSSSESADAGSQRRQDKRPPIPLVDSMLLRFLNTQKKSQQVTTDKKRLDNSKAAAITQQQDASVTTTQQDTLTAASSSEQQQLWLGQYNSHLVASSLLKLDGVSESLALQAGDAVQQHVLARTARQRVRIFLRNRDKLWKTNAAGTTTLSENVLSDNTTTERVLSDNNVLSQQQRDENQVSRDFGQVLELLLEKGLTGTDVCTIFSHTPSVALMRPTCRKEDEEDTSLDSTVTRAFTGVLSESLKLRRYDARKVLRNCPGLLTVRGSKNAYHVVSLLQKCGVSTNSLARDKNALPVLLSREPSLLFRFIGFLSSDAVRMNVQTIGPLLRRADCAPLLNAVAPVPRFQQENVENDTATSTSEDIFWRQASSQERREQIHDTYQQMSDTAWTLRHEIGTRDLSKVIAAYPSVLLLDAKTQILPVASYLMDDLGIWQDDLAKVLQLYPVLLGMNVEEMKRVVNYLRSLEVAEENLASIFRAFPSLFTLDIEKDMEPVVQFLREIGITNVGRFITRLPPVLGYSVENELVPKWEYLCNVCTLGSFELSAFPAYFSYPLDKRIKTRYEYLQKVKGIPTQLLSLDKVLRYGDRDFATRVARDENDAAFLQYCKDKQGRRDSASSRRKRTPTKQKKAGGSHRRSANKQT